MAKSRNREKNEINASSMADIAFLLLIFFLVTTTMDIDKGIMVKLPPIPENPEDIQEIDVNKRNAWPVLINARDQLLVKGEPMKVSNLRERTKEFLDNRGRNPNLSDSPDDAVVSLKNDRGTSYEMYIKVQNELKAAYNELRNEMSMRKYGRPFDELPLNAKKVIRNEYPIRISEAEPEDIGGTE